VKIRLLFLAVVMPLAAVGRPIWRSRLGLRFERGDGSYWRPRGDRVTRDALRKRP
jgi:hypothetical protein